MKKTKKGELNPPKTDPNGQDTGSNGQHPGGGNGKTPKLISVPEMKDVTRQSEEGDKRLQQLGVNTTHNDLGGTGTTPGKTPTAGDTGLAFKKTLKNAVCVR